MSISLIDPGFHIYITRKYGRFRALRLKFPSLFFLLTPYSQAPILQYLLIKNMNILPGNRNDYINQHYHLHFAVNLFLRLSSFPVTASLPVFLRPFTHTPFPALDMTKTGSHRPSLVFPGKNEIYQAFTQPSHNKQTTPTTPTVKPRWIVDNSNAGFYSQDIHTIMKFMMENTFVNAMQRLIKKNYLSNTITGTHIPIHVHRTTMNLQTVVSHQLKAPGLYPAKLTGHTSFTDFSAFKENKSVSGHPGGSNIDVSDSHLHIYPGSTPPLEKQQRISKQSITDTGSRYPTYLFLKGAKTTNMFIDATQRLIKKNHLPNTITGTYMPIQTNRTKMSHPIAAVSPQLKKTGAYHMTQTVPMEPPLTYQGIDIHGAFPAKAAADLHYFTPRQKVEYDLGKPVTVNGVSGISGVTGLPSHSIKNPGDAVESFSYNQPERSKKPAIDMNQLTDQVYRMLERKIKIERERRGW